MRSRLSRVTAVALLATAGLTCTDTTAVRAVHGASLAIAPAFAVAPPGGPSIAIERIRGVLRGGPGGADSAVAEATVEGDSAVLTFERVQIRGDSSAYTLRVAAFDSNGVMVFQGEDVVQLKPGSNAPAEPALEYTAPDAAVDSIAVTDGPVQLDWAGARQGDQSCRVRAPDPEATTTSQLAVQGFASGTAVAGVRVGWTSRDTSVVTVTPDGLVSARCANDSTWVVARTFLDTADSVLVRVNAPPFSLLMQPDSVVLARGATVQMTAVVVDEVGNELAETNVAWSSSDATRATVSPAGLVTGVQNGRVQITAAFEGRITVGIVHVVRPPATDVVVTPGRDTAAFGQRRAFFARAIGADGRVIGDASGFQWASGDTTVARVDASGLVQAREKEDSTWIFASLDGVKDSVRFVVEAMRPPGAISARIVDGATGAALQGVLVSGPATNTTTDPNGKFTLGGLQPGDSVLATFDGYQDLRLFDTPIYPNTTLQLPDAPMVPASAFPGTITGLVKHAISGAGVGGISVNAYRGINAAPSPTRPLATPDAVVSTGTDGSFTIPNLEAGVYTLLFTGTGYSNVLSIGVAVGGTTTDHDAVLLPPATASAGLAIVLTWAPCPTDGAPCDLDMHLTGPTVTDTTQRFHVHRDSRVYLADGDTIAALDLRDDTGPGPEIIGLRPSAVPGTYRLYVHDFTNSAVAASNALADFSLARVDVYQNNRVIATFFPPPGQAGTLWKVFEYDGARLKPINAIVHLDPFILP